MAPLVTLRRAGPHNFCCRPTGLVERRCCRARANVARNASGRNDTAPRASVRYLYDGECPLRKPEVEMLKIMDGDKGRIDFVDISTASYNPDENQGITYEDAMGQPAAITADGSVIRSVEVYRTLYEAVGLGFVWAAAELPVVGDVVQWVFDKTVEYRLAVTGRPPLEQLVARRTGQRPSLGDTSSKTSSTADADAFLGSPVGKFVSWLGNNVTNSKLNEGKIKFAVVQAGQYDEVAIAKELEDKIKSSKVMIFSFSNCPFCIKAKGLLSELGVEYEAMELDQLERGYAIRAELAKKTGRTSMPNIFIGGESIGGCNDGPGLMTLYNDGALIPKLKAAGVATSAK